MPLIRIVNAWLLLMLFSSNSWSQESYATPVVVSDVRRETLDETFTAIGEIQPLRMTHISSSVEGKVELRLAESGQYVSMGDLLCELKNPTLTAHFLEAEAEFELRSLNHFRTTELYHKEAASHQELTEHKFELDQAHAKLEGLKDQVFDLNIRAPFDAHIVKINIEKGSWVRRGDPIAYLISIDTVRVYVNVPERIVPKIHINDEVKVYVNALGSEPREGRVIATLAEGYVESHTFPIIIQLPNPDSKMLSNMSAEVRFKVDWDDNDILVHKDAIVNSSTGPCVFVVSADQVQRRPVKLGQTLNGYIAVQGEISEGELTVVRGNERLRDGQAVRILRKLQ